MKKRPPYLIQLICIFCAAAFLLGIAGAQQPDESDKDLSYWTVSGYRHGPSFFPLSRYNEIKPLKEGEWDFKHYHTYDEMIWWMKKWADEYPDLVDLYVAAKSFSGRDIYQLTLTNKKTGKHTDKPAMFVDGNRHAGEVTAAESAFWMIHYMLTNYGGDTEISRLLDGFTFYFRPKNNPDGSLLYLHTAQSLRSTVRYTSTRGGVRSKDIVIGKK
ncbi:MAG: hypothetical protein KKD56_02745 [Acidobacteria bacterium]|nr:hypothetical protein [Acidobacteriota bacterium]MBU1473502.1 hypothetical protein [Acidobacteriota bacterium]